MHVSGHAKNVKKCQTQKAVNVSFVAMQSSVSPTIVKTNLLADHSLVINKTLCSTSGHVRIQVNSYLYVILREL